MKGNDYIRIRIHHPTEQTLPIDLPVFSEFFGPADEQIEARRRLPPRWDSLFLAALVNRSDRPAPAVHRREQRSNPAPLAGECEVISYRFARSVLEVVLSRVMCRAFNPGQ
jgi:hypothetical protein